MGGSAGDSKIEYAPLMSQTQRQLLDQYIRAVASSLSGMTLGQPWMGPSFSSYTPTPFNLGGSWSSGQGYSENVPGKDESGPSEREDKTKHDTNGDSDYDSDKGGGKPKPKTTTQFTPEYINPLVTLLTGPLVNPFRYGMTGNYPKRR